MDRELVELGESVSEPFTLFSLLPMPPWLGPPLPRFLGIRWPWVQQAGSFPGKFDNYLTGHFEFHRGTEVTQPTEEEIELVRDESGAIKKLIKRRTPIGEIQDAAA